MPVLWRERVIGDKVELDLGASGSKSSDRSHERAAALPGEIAAHEEDPDGASASSSSRERSRAAHWSQSTPGGMTTTLSGGTSYRSTRPCFAQCDHATSRLARAKHDRFKRHLIRSMRGLFVEWP